MFQVTESHQVNECTDVFRWLEYEADIKPALPWGWGLPLVTRQTDGQRDGLLLVQRTQFLWNTTNWKAEPYNSMSKHPQSWWVEGHHGNTLKSGQYGALRWWALHTHTHTHKQQTHTCSKRPQLLKISADQRFPTILLPSSQNLSKWREEHPHAFTVLTWGDLCFSHISMCAHTSES